MVRLVQVEEVQYLLTHCLNKPSSNRERFVPLKRCTFRTLQVCVCEIRFDHRPGADNISLEHILNLSKNFTLCLIIELVGGIPTPLKNMNQLG